MPQPQTQTVGFHVSGEFITDLMRTWFWEEHRPIKTCIELCDCVCGDADDINTEAIFRDIIEGRKKLVGIDEFDLIDDGENIRSITDYMVNQEKQKVLAQIELEMVGNFRKYVDRFATIKSTHHEVLSAHGNPNSFQECVNYFCKEEYLPSEAADDAHWLYVSENKRLIDTPTMGGLWLINEPETAYEACDGDMNAIGKGSFWKKIYELKKNDPDFADRNMRYKVYMAPRPSSFEMANALVEAYERKHKKPNEPEPEYMTNDWFDYEFKYTKELQYLMQPDDIINWEGLIAPNGDFYSVNFGGHNVKAYYLMVRYPEKFGFKKGWHQNNHKIRIDNGLDELLEHGWCATRSVMFDQYVTPPLPKQPTKAQVNTILQAIDKHGVTINTEELISYL